MTQPKFINEEHIVRWVSESAVSESLGRPIVLAVVGLSATPHRPSYRVSEAMQQRGYRIIPINPNAETILGELCYPDLASVPAPVDVVQVFRREEHAPTVAREAAAEKTRLGLHVFWLQEGIINEEAAQIARSAGMHVVMDRCLYKEAMRWQEDHWMS